MPKRKRKKEDGSKEKVKYKGVGTQGSGRFQANIWIDGKKHYLGTFGTAKQAARAYDRAAMQAGRPPTKLNYQDKVPMDYKPKMKKLRSTNTIGYRGVCKNGNRFAARIYIGSRKQHLGLFGTTKEAAIAFDRAAMNARRPMSDLNFPNMMMMSSEESDNVMGGRGGDNNCSNHREKKTEECWKKGSNKCTLHFIHHYHGCCERSERWWRSCVQV